jgi:phenylalanyl-tRNA synthetase beta chain
VTLDGVERSLTPEDLVIADHAKGVAIAGVMGSAAAEVSPSTDEVLLESARFERRGVLRTSRRLELVTEASVRFSRGSDPEAVDPSAARAAALMAEWAGGEVLAGVVDQGSVPERRHLTVRPGRASLVLGFEVTASDVLDAFARLGIPAEGGGEAVEAEVPGCRGDLEQEVDLIEEVARVLGYDRVPDTLPAVRQPGSLPESWRSGARIREVLLRDGLREAISYSFASAGDLDLMGHRPDQAVRVANPLAADDAFLRTSLLPGLLRALGGNMARGVPGAALFEAGHVFRPGADGVDEREMVGGVFGGMAGEGVYEDRRPFDVFDAKGAVESVFAAFGIEEWDMSGPAQGPFHPGRSAALLHQGRALGVLGELHPRVAAGLDLPARSCGFELDASRLGATVQEVARYREVSRFPPVHRDLAFTVDAGTSAGAVRDAISVTGGPLLDSVVLFDVFAGDPVPQGKKSLAFSLDFRAPDRTLTDDEVDALVRAIVVKVSSELGGELRG